MRSTSASQRRQVDGGSAITNYQYSTDAGATWRDRQSGSTASPLHITTLSSNGTTPLEGGTEYPVEIRAVNVVGHGVASAVATGITTTVPDAPLIVSVDSRDSSRCNPLHATRQWRRRQSSDSSTASTAAVTWTDTGSLADEFVVGGLVNSTVYSFEIRAVNSKSAPGPPQTLRPIQALTTPGGAGADQHRARRRTLSVGFAAPSANGGSVITGYQYSTDGGATWRTRASGTIGSPLVIATASDAGAASLINATDLRSTAPGRQRRRQWRGERDRTCGTTWHTFRTDGRQHRSWRRNARVHLHSRHRRRLADHGDRIPAQRRRGVDSIQAR